VNRLSMSRKLLVSSGFLMLAWTNLSGCTSSNSDYTSGISVSGSLSQVTVSSVGDSVSKFESSYAVTDTKISLDCGTKGTFTALVNSSTGAFSVGGVPTGVPCSFNFVSATSGATKCQVQFQDSSNYDLNHKPMSTNTATASSPVSLGSISCDSSGKISIPASSIPNVDTGTTISSASAFDFSGSYVAATYDGALPAGYGTIGSCTTNCSGPAAGDPISLVRFHGVKFTPNGGQCTPAINVVCPASNGVDDATKEGYAMSIWGGDYAHGIGACGGKTGFSLAEARAYAGLDLDAVAPSLSGNPLSYGHYVWSTPTGFGTDAGWTQPWMWAGATSQYAIQDCQPVSVPSTSGAAARAGMACFAQTQNGAPSGIYVWNVNLSNAGGCVDTAGNPLMVNNWGAITFGACTNSASAFNSNMNSSSCSYTGSPVAGAPSQTFTCSWSGGTFRDLSGGTAVGNNNGPDFGNAYVMPGGFWSGQPATVLAQGAACAGGTSEASLITTASAGGTTSTRQKAAKELLYRYQCYANAYWQHSSNGGGSTSCARNYNFDWSTDNYANFVSGDDRSMKPQNAFITDRVFYAADGTWAYLSNSDNRFQSIPTASGSTLCPMQSITDLKFQKVTTNKILVNFSQKTVMQDRSTACQAAVSAALAGGGTLSPDPTGLNNLYKNLQTQRLLFYLNK
jgi:hypothetical protein